MPRDIDDINADLEAAQADDLGDQDQEELELEQDDDQTDDDPPGFMSHEEWIASGKNPDDYKGKNAYNAEYDRIQENKGLKNDLKDIRETLNVVVDAAETTRLEDLAEHKRELEAKLAQQTEDMQTKDALATQKEIDAIDDTPKAKPINPLINDFFVDNPVIDKDNAQFNQEVMDDFTSFYHSRIDALTSNGTRGITDAQVAKALKIAFDGAKEMNKEVFVSSRNNRGGNTRRGKGKTPPVTTKLSEYQIDDKDDLRNQGAAQAIYEKIYKKNPKTAEKFRKNLLGG